MYYICYYITCYTIEYKLYAIYHITMLNNMIHILLYNMIYIGGQPPCKHSKQPTWFVPVQCVWVIDTFRGGGFQNPVQTKVGPEQTVPNQILSLPNQMQTNFQVHWTVNKPILMFVCSFIVKPCPNPVSLID